MPMVPVLPAFGIFFNFMLACGLDLMTWVYFGIWLAVGLIIYFGYGISHSNLDVEMITRGEFEVSLIDHSTNYTRDMSNESYSLDQRYMPPQSPREDEDNEYELKETETRNEEPRSNV